MTFTSSISRITHDQIDALVIDSLSEVFLLIGFPLVLVSHDTPVKVKVHIMSSHICTADHAQFCTYHVTSNDKSISCVIQYVFSTGRD